MYPEVQIRQNGMEMVSNYKHGWKLASSVTGSATGKRGNRAICDDLNNVKESESKAGYGGDESVVSGVAVVSSERHGEGR